MAKEVTRTGEGKGMVAFGQALDAKFDALSYVDLGTFEENVGVLLEGKYLARAMGWDNLVFCAYLAQRERLTGAGRQTTMDEMLGQPGRGTALRQIVKVHWATTRHQSEYAVRCRVPDGSKVLAGFALFLNEAVAKILTEDYLGEGTPNAPRYSAIGVGSDVESSEGHSHKLLTVLRERIAAAKSESTQ
jgi:hypothetical protein